MLTCHRTTGLRPRGVPVTLTCLTEFQGSHFRKFSGSAQLIEDVVVSLCRSLKQRETDDHQRLTSPTQQRSERPEFSISLADALTWKTTLDFSRRYVLMLAPMMSPFFPKPISIYFPKRLLLSFRVVLAFPIDCRQTLAPEPLTQSLRMTLLKRPSPPLLGSRPGLSLPHWSAAQLHPPQQSISW